MSKTRLFVLVVLVVFLIILLSDLAGIQVIPVPRYLMLNLYLFLILAVLIIVLITKAANRYLSPTR